MKPGQRVRVVKFDQNGFSAFVLNGREGVVVPARGPHSNFIHVQLDEPFNSGGNNPVEYGTADRPMLFIEFELEKI